MKKRSFSFEEYEKLMGKVKARPASSFKGSALDKRLAQQVDVNTRKKRLHDAFHREKNKRGY
jgi:hypothetical protein